MFSENGAVWPYSLPKGTPKAYGFDNANKILSSTTASGSANFNGTVISVFSFGDGNESTMSFDMNKGNPRRKLELPQYYTNIEPVDGKTSSIPSVDEEELEGDVSKVKANCENGEMKWRKSDL